MPTTYVLTDTVSDLTGPGPNADFNNALGIGGAQINQTLSIAHSTTTAREVSSAFTEPADPGSQGGAGSQNYTVNVQVSAGNTAVTLQVRVARVNSAGVQQTVSAYTATQAMGAGAYVFNVSAAALGTFVTGDRLRVDYSFGSSTSMGGAPSITLSGTNNVVAPWTLAAVHSRTVDVTATPTVTAAGQVEAGAATHDRTTDFTATPSVTAAGMRDVLRTADFTATPSVTTAGQVVSGAATVERAAGFTSTPAVTVSGTRDLPRSATFTATPTVATAGQVETPAAGVVTRSVAVTASPTITTAGQTTVLRAASFTSASSVTVAALSEYARSANFTATATIDASGVRIDVSIGPSPIRTAAVEADTRAAVVGAGRTSAVTGTRSGTVPAGGTGSTVGTRD